MSFTMHLYLHYIIPNIASLARLCVGWLVLITQNIGQLDDVSPRFLPFLVCFVHGWLLGRFYVRYLEIEGPTNE